MTVYELTHLFFRSGGEPVYSPKGLGLFASTEIAEEAVRYYKTQPGFRDAPDAFSVQRRPVYGEVSGGMVFEALVYLHSADYEFEVSAELGALRRGERRRKRRCAVLYGERRAGPCPRDYRGEDRESLPCRPSELGRGLYRFRLICRFTAKDLRDRAETGNMALADHDQEDGIMEIRRFVPGEEAALSRLAARTLLEYNSKHTAPEEEPWIPCSWRNTAPRRSLAFRDRTHLCALRRRSAPRHGRRPQDRRGRVPDLRTFLTPETIGKDTAPCFSRAGSR